MRSSPKKDGREVNVVTIHVGKEIQFDVIDTCETSLYLWSSRTVVSDHAWGVKSGKLI